MELIEKDKERDDLSYPDCQKKKNTMIKAIEFAICIINIWRKELKYFLHLFFTAEKYSNIIFDIFLQLTLFVDTCFINPI